MAIDMLTLSEYSCSRLQSDNIIVTEEYHENQFTNAHYVWALDEEPVALEGLSLTTQQDSKEELWRVYCSQRVSYQSRIMYGYTYIGSYLL